MVFRNGIEERNPDQQVFSAVPNGEDYQLNRRVQSSGLYHINVENENLNDVQLKAVLEKYSLYKKLYNRY